jgi:hypothetical protein
MHLQKTGPNTVSGSNSGDQSVKNVSSKVQAQTVKTSAPVSAVRSAASLTAAAGLPQDKLSASIVTFARFFSLPLKPEMLAAIRRQSFPPQGAASPASQQISAASPAADDTSSSMAAKIREALSLSAAAAESKGVGLDPKALEAYAEAVDPELQKRQNSGEQKKKRRDKDQNEKLKTSPITASAIEKTVLQSVQNNPLLAILNKLPGKNGQRWIVLPFDFPQDDPEYRVSMRILLDERTSNRAACMALDIAESADTGRRWSFMLESANEKPVRLTLYSQPDLPPAAQSRLKRELSSLLEIPSECVFIKNAESSFPCESERGEQLPSIDEAV